MLYKLVRIIFESAKWFWVAVLVAFTVTYLGNIAPLDRSSFVKGFSSSVMGYLFSPLPHLLITLCLVAALLVITLIAWIIVARHKDDPAALPAQAPMSMVSSYDALPEILMQLLHQKLPELEQQVSSNLEARLFIKAIRQSIGIEDLKLLPVPIPTQVLADARAIALRALKQCPEIGSAEVQEIITACLDTRELSKQVVEELTGNIWDYNVRKIAWSLLSQTWRMPPDAWASVVSFLNDEQAVICAAAARLLRWGKDLPQAERAEAMERIRKILADEHLSRRPLDAPDRAILRLDDELYDTLRALAD